MHRLLVLLVLIVCACGEPASNPQPPASHNSAFDAQLQALEKAKGVNATVQEADQRRRAEEDAQTRE
jgi:hypothetical protein